VTRRSTLGALAALLAGATLVLAACGGSGSSSSGNSAAATTTGAGSPATSERLDQATWARLVQIRSSAQAVNQKSIATFRRCKSLVLSNVSQQKVQACMSTSASDVVREGRKVQAALADVTSMTTGACKTAATDLGGNVTLYIATVNGIDELVKSGNVPSSQRLGSALAQLGRTRALFPPFEQACKPL
jgi:hypothetical protein